MIQGCWRRSSVLALAVLTSAVLATDPRRPGELFPPRAPFDTGRLKVSDLHTISYALCGNPQGKPVFVLHGGPGFGCYPRLTQYFDPEKFLIVLHDQRGSGQSSPIGELRENTTPDLVADIERLRKHLKIESKILLFGGSWGSTLALAYAEAHPENVSGMVLRGVYTCTRAEIDRIFGNGGVRWYFPEALARLEAALPPGNSGLSAATLLEIFKSDDRELALKVAGEWNRCGMKLSRLHTPDERLEEGFGDWDPLPPRARRERHLACRDRRR